MSELKPCPFCGSQPDDNCVGTYFVVCGNCGIDGPLGKGNNPASAIEAWNRRTQPAQVPTLTDEEILKLAYPLRWQEVDDFEADKAVNFAQMVEAALIAKWQGDKK